MGITICFAQGLLDNDAAMAMVLQALDYSLPKEAALACDFFTAVKQPSQVLQHSFFGGLCSQGSPLLALKQLQQSPELASQEQGCYVKLLLRLVPGQTLCCTARHALQCNAVASCSGMLLQLFASHQVFAVFAKHVDFADFAEIL